MCILQALVIAAVILVSTTTAPRAQDRSVLLTNAWDSLRKENYAAALRSASPCVAQFGGEALRVQARLEAGEAPKPLPPGKVDPASLGAQATFANGALNDAAACMFVLGTAQEHLSNCPDARRTYRDLAKLTFARIWDPQGWFWAPADAAEDGLNRLKGHC